MLFQLNDVAAVANAERSIHELLTRHSEWFLAQDGGAPLALGNSEFEFSTDHRRLIFSSWTETGSRSWRITAWNWTGEKLLLEASRRMGAEVAKLELVPRASARAIVASIAAARQTRCEKLAQLVAQTPVCEAEGVGGMVLGDISNDLHPESKTQHPKAHRLKSVPLAKIESAILSPGMRRDQ